MMKLISRQVYVPLLAWASIVLAAAAALALSITCGDYVIMCPEY